MLQGPLINRKKMIRREKSFVILMITNQVCAMTSGMSDEIYIATEYLVNTAQV
jgi:hypothetical protein